MAENVTSAVHPGALAVPHGENAIVLALTAQLRLLRAPHRGCRQILVEPALKPNIAFVEKAPGAEKLAVEGAKGRTAVTGHKTGGVEAVAPVELLLHQAEPHQSLKTSHENVALGEIVFIVQCDVVQRHTEPPRASLPLCARYFQRGTLLCGKYRAGRRRNNRRTDRPGAVRRTEKCRRA